MEVVNWSLKMGMRFDGKPQDRTCNDELYRKRSLFMPIRSISSLMLLICIGFIGNYLNIPMFFGADFLFGSIAVMLVLYFYGVRWGMFAALVAHSYTWHLWGHPFGFINFMCETLFVGFFGSVRYFV